MGNEVNGAVLLGSVDEQALNEDLAISNRMQRKTILAQIDKLKELYRKEEEEHKMLLRIQEEERKEQLRKQGEEHKMQLRAQEEDRKEQLRKQGEEHKSLLRKQEEDYKMKLRREEEDEKLAREMERMDMKEQKHESKLVKDPRLVYKTKTYPNGDKYAGNYNN